MSVCPCILCPGLPRVNHSIQMRHTNSCSKDPDTMDNNIPNQDSACQLRTRKASPPHRRAEEETNLWSKWNPRDMGGRGAMSLKTLAAYSVLMLAKSWKMASDFHVPAPKIPKTSQFSHIGTDFRKISPGQKLVVKAGQHPNRSPMFGWRAQNPKSAVWISDFGFYNFCQEVGGYQHYRIMSKLYKIDTWDVWHRDILWWTFPEVNAAEGNFFLQFHVSAHVPETGQTFGHQPRRHITESQWWMNAIGEKKLGLVSDKFHYTWVF